MIRGTRNAGAVVFGCLVVAVLAACTSSSGSPATATSAPSATPTTAAPTAPTVSFQVRPVLTERAAHDGDCPAIVVPTSPPPRRGVVGACSLDNQHVYALGPAAITERDVTQVFANGAVEGDPNQNAVTISLDPAATATFADLTGRAYPRSAPRNQFALLVDGVVQSAPSVDNGPITGGHLELSLADATAVTAFLAGWPASVTTVATAAP